MQPTAGHEFLRIPFIGTISDNEVLEYMLLKMTSRSALISIPQWASTKARLDKASSFDLQLNNYFEDQNGPRDTLKGRLELIDSSGAQLSRLYRVEFPAPVKAHYIFKDQFGISVDKMSETLLALVKDSLLIKNGIYIHLSHLIPFFSRILTISEDRFDQLKQKVLDEIHLQVFFNMMKLESLFETLKDNLNDDRNFWKYVEILHFKSCIQSELDQRLLELAFDSKINLESKREGYTLKSFHVYLEAVKTLEHQIYTNYNNIVVLYSKAIKVLYSHRRRELRYV